MLRETRVLDFLFCGTKDSRCSASGMRQADRRELGRTHRRSVVRLF